MATLDAGQEDLVREVRLCFQQAMERNFIGAVQPLARVGGLTY